MPLGHISNSLPLALESIIQLHCDESNTHCVLVLIMFCSRERFSQRICDIQVHMHFTNIYVSILNIFTNGVEAMLDVPCCRRSGNGGPQTCLPAAWLKGRPSTAHLHHHELKTLARGQASQGGRHGPSSGTASSGWLARRRRDQGGVPREVPVTQAMTTEGARRVPARAVSSFPLWCKGSKRRREHQAKAPVLVQRDQD